MFLDSTGFPFCIDWNLVSACSPVIVLYQSLDCFVVVVICGCADNGSAQVDYCVCGVRLLSSLVFGFLAGSRLWEFLTN